MGIAQQALQFGQRRIARKMLRAVPFLGAIIALATLGRAVRRKGMVRGAVDTTLDFIPYVGGVKNTLEVVRGRDFLEDRGPHAAVPTPARQR
ncbi:MAG TPA: hypothetical protein VMO26_24290 [Vicinamibacterales bacterium]|nr:hypothetical protein [Vicinamibacterales bacterium]